MSMTLSNCPYLTFEMGFMIGSTAIPDPNSFTGKESDLDTMGERDATGYLHRNKVATKHPISLEWKSLPWGVIKEMCALMTSAKFSFTFPNPFSSAGTQTIDAYVGDRDFTAVWSPTEGEWIGDLKVSFIEY